MKLRNEEKGMSLVEVVVSITILSIILLSFASLFQQSSKTTENN
ncbi:MAG TPA: type II secretion system protein, partial [Bacilli bacterium]|nr:type II secretion system protein [Bacilli bacterium]